MRKVLGFDGKLHNFNIQKNRKRKNSDNKSSLHLEARELLKSLWPRSPIYEEVTLPGSKRLGRASLLYADFFLPEISLVVEVHGKQHYQYCSFFHKDMMSFLSAKTRDKDKSEWCSLNDITIAILPYNERSQWKSILMSKLTD
jgi:hypothetical protein